MTRGPRKPQVFGVVYTLGKAFLLPSFFSRLFLVFRRIQTGRRGRRPLPKSPPSIAKRNAAISLPQRGRCLRSRRMRRTYSLKKTSIAKRETDGLPYRILPSSTAVFAQNTTKLKVFGFPFFQKGKKDILSNLSNSSTVFAPYTTNTKVFCPTFFQKSWRGSGWNPVKIPRRTRGSAP